MWTFLKAKGKYRVPKLQVIWNPQEINHLVDQNLIPKLQVGGNLLLPELQVGVSPELQVGVNPKPQVDGNLILKLQVDGNLVLKVGGNHFTKLQVGGNHLIPKHLIDRIHPTQKPQVDGNRPVQKPQVDKNRLMPKLQDDRNCLIPKPQVDRNCHIPKLQIGRSHLVKVLPTRMVTRYLHLQGNSLQRTLLDSTSGTKKKMANLGSPK